MTVDTKSMRDLMDATPGDRVAMEKAHMRQLLDFVDAGQTAAQALAGLNKLLGPAQPLAIAA